MIFHCFSNLFYVILFFVITIVYPQSTQAQSNSKTRIAILYFENNAMDKSFTPLSKGLCDMMISDFSKASKFSVVERNRLEEILKELKLGQAKLFNSATTAKIGKLLGAEYLVFGSYFEFMGSFRMDARIVKVETGQIAVSFGVSGKADNFELLLKELVTGLHEKMNRPISSKNTIKDSKQITLSSVNLYGSALDKIDNGDKKGARELLRDIVESSPDFSLAKKMLFKVSN